MLVYNNYCLCYYSGMATTRNNQSAPSKLQTELQQSVPFESKAVEVLLNLMRSHSLLVRAQTDLLKKNDLSLALYNIMRILRGAGKNGLPCSEIGRRMITREPDVTRHIDRLVERGFVVRSRLDGDRRVVIQMLTPAGRKKLRELDAPMKVVGEGQFSHMSEKELTTLNTLLVKARAQVE